MVFISKFLTREVLTIYKDGFYLLKSLVDGISGLIAETVRSYLHIKGINFDLPHTINIVPIYDGVTHVSGDMFHVIPNLDYIKIRISSKKNLIHYMTKYIALDSVFFYILTCH